MGQTFACPHLALPACLPTYRQFSQWQTCSAYGLCLPAPPFLLFLPTHLPCPPHHHPASYAPFTFLPPSATHLWCEQHFLLPAYLPATCSRKYLPATYLPSTCAATFPPKPTTTCLPFLPTCLPTPSYLPLWLP